MPAILLWNIEHSSGFQDAFSPKNAFINEVIGSCIQKYGAAAALERPLQGISTKRQPSDHARPNN